MNSAARTHSLTARLPRPADAHITKMKRDISPSPCSLVRWRPNTTNSTISAIHPTVRKRVRFARAGWGRNMEMSIPSGVKDTTIAAVAPELDALTAEAMAEWKVPAVALAVVQNGETALLKAWGQRDVEAALPTTTQTQFTICSITKMFTATALALLVDEGRLDWSKPVRDYIPEFRLHDPVATERVTVRDLL